MIGTSFGSYQVVAKLGAGGMGEVYRARDTKLNRDVAIKVLPEAFALDAERLARFTREAQVLASLNHPNIAAIYGIEEQGRTHALVMELVEGEDLSQRIARGAIPLDEALPIARQIAEALEAAHEQGIVHRDLKPANIKVRPDGTVKVLDFGLAKALDAHASSATAEAMNSPTITSPAMTVRGMILGTAAYMSPEQATGKPVDRRSDLWALGAVLFEMLSGRQLFGGETVSHSIAAVLKGDPDWTALPRDTPDSIRRLLRRCLEKDRQRRCASASDARLEIDDAIHPSPGSIAPAPSGGPRHTGTLAAAVVVAGLVVAAAVWVTARRPAESVTRGDVVHFAVPDSDRVFVSAADGDFALSPDGRSLAFVGFGEGAPRIWLRSLDAIEMRPLVGTETAGSVVWSPDSRSLAFRADGRLKTIAVAGGAPVVIAGSGVSRPGAPGRDGVMAWGADGHILNSNSRGIWRINANDGVVTRVVPVERDEGYVFAELLPDGRHIVVGVRSADSAKAGTFAIALDGGRRTRIFPFPTKAHYSLGRLLYIRDGVLYAHAFDLSQLQALGEPVRLAEATGFSVSQQGAVAYLRPTTAIGAAASTQLSWRDRTGQSIGRIDQAMGATRPTLSPDGRQLAMMLRSDVWVLELARGVLSRVLSGGAGLGNVNWVPDSQTLVYQRGALRGGKDGILSTLVGSAGKETSVLELHEAFDHAHPTDVSADGRYLAFDGGADADDVWVLPLQGEPVPRAFAESPSIETQAVFSPDAHWIAYSSDTSGRYEIYVQRFPDGGPRIQVSPDGGGHARWRRDGKELFYMAGDGTLMAVPVGPGPQATITFGRPAPLFRFFAPSRAPSGKPPYDVTADGQRFIVSDVVRQADPVLHVLLNWPAVAAADRAQP